MLLSEGSFDFIKAFLTDFVRTPVVLRLLIMSACHVDCLKAKNNRPAEHSLKSHDARLIRPSPMTVYVIELSFL